jgi:hypothetical protein
MILVYDTSYYDQPNGSIIGYIMHVMLEKSWCGATVNEERGEDDIILIWYSTMACKTRKFNSKYIMYNYLHWDST